MTPMMYLSGFVFPIENMPAAIQPLTYLVPLRYFVIILRGIFLKGIGLEVRKHQQTGDEAMVEFVARYKIGGRAERLHEVSRFIREDGRWFYVDGSFPESDK
ncbi:MAG: YchJ family metal-binding protein, partial [Burkholderiaceae bacterium]